MIVIDVTERTKLLKKCFQFFHFFFNKYNFCTDNKLRLFKLLSNKKKNHANNGFITDVWAMVPWRSWPPRHLKF